MCKGILECAISFLFYQKSGCMVLQLFKIKVLGNTYTKHQTKMYAFLYCDLVSTIYFTIGLNDHFYIKFSERNNKPKA